MKSRPLGKTGVTISEVGLGCWQLGGDCWGPVGEQQALDTLAAAADAGVTFFDTADVYGSGRSESLIGRFLKSRRNLRIFVATKVGRFPDPGWPKNFSWENFRTHTEDSLKRLGLDALDLTQLHTIPPEYLRRGEVFDWLDRLKEQGKILRYGASVESADDGFTCLEHPGVASLQIIFNVLRQKPLEGLLDQAKKQGVAIIVRLPLASGLLTGKFTAKSTFPPDDHRNFNRDGQRFNVGETFAGLGLERGVELVEQIRPLVPNAMTMAQMALRWILDHDAVSTVIPGAKNPQQAHANAHASDLPPLPQTLHKQLAEFYQDKVATHIRGPN